PLDILGPIRDTLVLLKGQFEQAHVIVSTSFDEGLPLIAADSNQLKQLFLNICVNAIEAMSSGGQLHVRVRAQEALGARTVTAEFEDSGGGIPAQVLSKIFDPFVTTKERGSGLGLSICRGIADAHRAAIYAMNSPRERGAVIAIEFPALPHNSGDRANGVDGRVIQQPSVFKSTPQV